MPDVLILQASPRDGNGARIAERLSRRLQARGQTVATERLADYPTGPCTACGLCHTHPGFCRYDGDVHDRGRDLISMISGGANVIIVSPIWFYGLPSQLKALIDRTQTLWELSETDDRPLPSSGRSLACVFTAARWDGDRLFEAAGLVTRCLARALRLTAAEALELRGLDALDRADVPEMRRRIDAWADALPF